MKIKFSYSTKDLARMSKLQLCSAIITMQDELKLQIEKNEKLEKLLGGN